jgi:hypothetical protein
MLLTVYVPIDETFGIAPGSAIVGGHSASPRIVVDYEGGLFQQVGFDQFETRLRHAADRHTWHGRGFPTSARLAVPANVLKAVGTYDYEPGGRHDLVVDDQPALDAWIARFGEQAA